jgi:MFS family permease
VAVPFRARLGALQERDFRLLFSATTVTTIGDRLAGIALVFAVLEFGSATDLGLVLAARQLVEAGVLLGGGVLSDRLPRNLVLVGASLTQGIAQAITAALVLSGTASVASLVVLQALYGVGGGLVVPAEVGLVPQTVSPERLQQANALQGLSRNVVGVLGPAVGGVLVVAGSPGGALAVDSASFVVCATLLVRIRIPPRERRDEPAGFFRELREGWREFTGRAWLWKSVVLIGIANFAWVGGWGVLGPVVANNELGGAGAWATILTAWGIGSIVGGVVALRIRPRRPLFVAILAPLPFVLQLAALAMGAPVWALSIVGFVAGAGISIHLTLWFTVFQREVPEHAQSRVSSYDAFGSFVLNPLGMALVGPVAATIGVDETLWAAASLCLVMQLWAAFLPSVRAIRAPFAPAPAV